MCQWRVWHGRGDAARIYKSGRNADYCYISDLRLFIEHVRESRESARTKGAYFHLVSIAADSLVFPMRVDTHDSVIRDLVQSIGQTPTNLAGTTPRPIDFNADIENVEQSFSSATPFALLRRRDLSRLRTFS